jgi:hypothetical protein
MKLVLKMLGTGHKLTFMETGDKHFNFFKARMQNNNELSHLLTNSDHAFKCVNGIRGYVAGLRVSDVGEWQVMWFLFLSHFWFCRVLPLCKLSGKWPSSASSFLSVFLCTSCCF